MNAYNGNTLSDFNASAADIDGENGVTVDDVTSLANKVLCSE